MRIFDRAGIPSNNASQVKFCFPRCGGLIHNHVKDSLDSTSHFYTYSKMSTFWLTSPTSLDLFTFSLFPTAEFFFFRKFLFYKETMFDHLKKVIIYSNLKQ